MTTYNGTYATSWQAQAYKQLNRRHNSHQETMPGNTDPECPVCLFNTGKLYWKSDKKKS
jgi:hypothetical protein